MELQGFLWRKNYSSNQSDCAICDKYDLLYAKDYVCIGVWI